MESLERILDRDALLDLAGERYFERGVSYYEEAYALLKSRELMKRLGRGPEFAEYLEIIRLEYKRRRNFMKLLDGME